MGRIKAVVNSHLIDLLQRSVGVHEESGDESSSRRVLRRWFG